MSNQQPTYSVKDIILRYESEEEEFVRELESMMTHENVEEEPDHDVDGPPILSVLCSLVDEIGSLRTENRRLKTRLIPTTPRTTSKNVVQRMSAMFDQLPRLRRINRSHESVHGARERLSTPPKDNSMTSTDASASGIPPIVRPEMSDSEIDEQIFNDDDHRSRDISRRCDSVRHSTSACTSPSSASSSRDPSETMTTSRSSFLDLFGFRRRSTHIPQPTSSYAKTVSTKQIVKKRRKKVSGNDSESSGMYLNNMMDDDRLPNKPPRPSSYYRRDDSEDSDYLRQRKSSSFLSVNNGGYCYRETQIQHEKETLEAEIEELKMRNQRLVEQLREKSQQQSKLQCQLHKVEMQMNTLNRRCAMTEAVDRLTLDERIERTATQHIKKIEERLRIFENQMQNAKLETANAHQMVINSTCNERIAHQNCLEKLENIQREHMRVIHASLIEIGVDEMNLKRRLDNFPTYEALYAFTHSIVRRLNEAKWTILEKTYESSRTQMDLIATQSTLLVTHAQMERMRLSKNTQKRVKRPASFHGNEYQNRIVHQNLSFYLPFKLQGSRVENMRRISRKKSPPNDRNIEEEFLKLFSYSKDFCDPSPPEIHRRASNRIENMMREMNGGQQQQQSNRPIRRQPSAPIKGNVRRPISLVETEEKRYRRNEETRRSIKFIKTNSIDQHRDGLSSQDIPSGLNSPANTPIFSRRIIIPTKGNNYDHVAEVVPQRVRKLERAFSTESRNTVDSTMKDEPRRAVKLQRSQPVSRIKQPTVQLNRFKTLDTTPPSSQNPSSSPSTQQQSNIQYRPRTLESSTPNRLAISPPVSTSRIPQVTRQRSWFEKLKGIGK